MSLTYDGQVLEERTCQHQPEPIRQMALWLLQLVDHQLERLNIGLETQPFLWSWHCSLLA